MHNIDRINAFIRTKGMVNSWSQLIFSAQSLVSKWNVIFDLCYGAMSTVLGWFLKLEMDVDAYHGLSKEAVCSSWFQVLQLLILLVTLHWFLYGEVGPKCCRVAGKLPAQVMADGDFLQLWLSASTGCRLRSANVSSWRWFPLNWKSTLYKWSFEGNHPVGCNNFLSTQRQICTFIQYAHLGFILGLTIRVKSVYLQSGRPSIQWSLIFTSTIQTCCTHFDIIISEDSGGTKSHQFPTKSAELKEMKQEKHLNIHQKKP